MTKPLPKPNVQVAVKRTGPPRLTSAERQQLASIEDPTLKKVMGEIFIAGRANQDNFDEITQWFPIQPADVADVLRPNIANLLKVWPDNTVSGRINESKGGEEGTAGKWRVLNEFRYANEQGVMGFGNIPCLVVDPAGATPFVQLRIANFDKTKTLMVNTTTEMASATQLIPGIRMVQSYAVGAGLQADQFFGSILAPEMWEVDLEAWENGEPCQLEVRAANMNTIIPGEYPKAFIVVTFDEGV